MTSFCAFGHTISRYNIRGNQYIKPLRIIFVNSTSGPAGSHVLTTIPSLTFPFQLFPWTQEAVP
jgi:hypothetical protein